MNSSGVTSWVTYIALVLSGISFVWNIFNTYRTQKLRKDITLFTSEDTSFMDVYGLKILKDIDDLSNVPDYLNNMVRSASAEDDLCKMIADYHKDHWTPVWSAVQSSCRQAKQHDIVSSEFYADFLIDCDGKIGTAFLAMQKPSSTQEQYKICLNQISEPIESIVNAVRNGMSQKRSSIRKQYLKN